MWGSGVRVPLAPPTFDSGISFFALVCADFARARGGITLVSSPLMGMTLRPSEQQAEALRRQATAEGRSMQAVALSAIDEYIARRAHKTKVAAALQRVVREEAGVLERLKDA